MFDALHRIVIKSKPSFLIYSLFGAAPYPSFSKNSFFSFKLYHIFLNLYPIVDVDNDHILNKRPIVYVDSDHIIKKRTIVYVDNDCFILKRAIVYVDNDCFILKRAFVYVDNDCLNIQIPIILYPFFRILFNNHITIHSNFNLIY